jgi:hypothetical protein
MFTIRAFSAVSIEQPAPGDRPAEAESRAGSCDFDRRSPRDVVVRNGIVDKVAMPLVDRFFA